MTSMRVLSIIVLIPLCLVLGATVTILRLYWRAYRELAPSRERLTPLHVALVSAGVIMLAAGLAWAIVQRAADEHPFDLPAVIRFGLYGIGSLFILAALWVIAGVQRRRIHFHRPEVDVQVDVADEEPAGDEGNRRG